MRPLQRHTPLMSLVLSVFLAFPFSSIARAAEEDDSLDFFKEEAKVVSASLEPSSMDQSPSTVYVVTQKDIRDSGAQTLWEALRSVPGLDVMTGRTSDGEISVRGFNGFLAQRLKLLVDGREMNYMPLGNVVWASLPVPVSLIDRIEVVQGPASAVYGPGAMAGVINIITKTPDQLQGGVVSYAGGERHMQGGDLVYGRKTGNLGYRINGGYNQAYSFNQASHQTNELSNFAGLVNYDFSERSALNIEAGLSHHAPELFGTQPFILAGHTSFVKTDYHWADTTFRAYWNRDRSQPSGERTIHDDDINYDQVDTTLMQAFSLPWKNRLVFGGNYRFNTVTAPATLNGKQTQDLWSVFGEDKWQIVNPLMLMVSGRVDHHPNTPTRVSPRASLVYTPVTRHVFRASAGRGFRNPTLYENYMYALGPFSHTYTPGVGGTLFPFVLPSRPNVDLTINVAQTGSETLGPEQMDQVETGYDGKFERVHVMGTLFHYRASDAILPGDPTLTSTVASLVPAVPPTSGNVINPPTLLSTATYTQPFTNMTDIYKVSGGEFGLEYFAFNWLKTFGNYSYQYMWRDSGVPIHISPRHKANMGLRVETHGWTAQWESHWVDYTRYYAFGVATKAYWLCNAHLGYAFAGRLKGLELGFDAYNLLNHAHYEIPATLGGELIRSSLRGTVRYEF